MKDEGFARRDRARSGCVITRRRRVSIRPKAERWARHRRAFLSGREAPVVCVIARGRRVSIRPKAEGFSRRRRALCLGAKRP